MPSVVVRADLLSGMPFGQIGFEWAYAATQLCTRTCKVPLCSCGLGRVSIILSSKKVVQTYV
jgi:hypothetical protein